MKKVIRILVDGKSVDMLNEIKKKKELTYKAIVKELIIREYDKDKEARVG
jgi:hypothetical protein